MQNKRVVRGNTYAQRVPMRTYNVTSTLDDRDHLGIPGTPGLMQRKLHQRSQLLPNLADGQIQVKYNAKISYDDAYNIYAMAIKLNV